MQSIFLSHSHADKEFARKLAEDLKRDGVRVWIDEAEIRVGDSLIAKLREGIDLVDYVGVILSPDSVGSTWVKYEVDVAMNQEIAGKRVKVLPILYKDCDLPGFLLGKVYADFRGQNYYNGLKAVMQRLQPEDISLSPMPLSQSQDATTVVLVQDSTQYTTVNLRLRRLGRNYNITAAQKTTIADFLIMAIHELGLGKPVFLPQSSFLLQINWHLYQGDKELNPNQSVGDIPTDKPIDLVCEVDSALVMYAEYPAQFRQETWKRILEAEWTPIEAEAIGSVFDDGYEKSSGCVARVIVEAKDYRPEIQRLFAEIIELEKESRRSPLSRYMRQ
jgi:hypothetical protein